jgi:hypothetical protein
VGAINHPVGAGPPAGEAHLGAKLAGVQAVRNRAAARSVDALAAVNPADRWAAGWVRNNIESENSRPEG